MTILNDFEIKLKFILLTYLDAMANGSRITYLSTEATVDSITISITAERLDLDSDSTDEIIFDGLSIDKEVAWLTPTLRGMLITRYYEKADRLNKMKIMSYNYLIATH